MRPFFYVQMIQTRRLACKAAAFPYLSRRSGVDPVRFAGSLWERTQA
jgi:hypothetical protein